MRTGSQPEGLGFEILRTGRNSLGEVPKIFRRTPIRHAVQHRQVLRHGRLLRLSRDLEVYDRTRQQTPQQE